LKVDFLSERERDCFVLFWFVLVCFGLFALVCLLVFFGFVCVLLGGVGCGSCYDVPKIEFRIFDSQMMVTRVIIIAYDVSFSFISFIV